jgi:hypothetical protein
MNVFFPRLKFKRDEQDGGGKHDGFNCLNHQNAFPTHEKRVFSREFYINLAELNIKLTFLNMEFLNAIFILNQYIKTYTSILNYLKSKIYFLIDVIYLNSSQIFLSLFLCSYTSNQNFLAIIFSKILKF